MAQFRAVIRGQRGEASRLGSKKTGLRATVNGWHSGVTVTADHFNDADEFSIYATGGSNGAARQVFLGTVKRDGESVTFVRAEG